MRAVLEILRDMARKRQRCMFCEDSRGTDIEHFWPKSAYPARTFDWFNLLLACAACNQAKSRSFPLDPRGRPLLIDPTAEDPWDYLFFDAATGNVTARFTEAGLPHPKGKTTMAILRPLGDEAVTEGRLRAYRTLARAVRAFLAQYSNAPDDAGRRRAVDELRQAVCDSDSYGLGQWFLCRDGREMEPFRMLRERYPAIWSEVQRAVKA